MIKVKILCSSSPLSLSRHTISVKSADLQASPHQLMAHNNSHTEACELQYLGCFDQSTLPANPESRFFTQLHLFMLCLTIYFISVVTEAPSVPSSWKDGEVISSCYRLHTQAHGRAGSSQNEYYNTQNIILSDFQY